MREWRGKSGGAFKGQERHEVEDMSIQLHELTRAVKRISGNNLPSGGITQIINTGSPGGVLADGHYGDVDVYGTGTGMKVVSWGGRIVVSSYTGLIDALATIAGSGLAGGWIYCKAGNYDFTATLNMTFPNIRIEGAGNEATYFRMADYNSDIISIQHGNIQLAHLNIRHGTGAYNGAGSVGSGRGVVLECPSATLGENIAGIQLEHVTITNTASWGYYETGIYALDDISYGDGFASAGTFSDTAEHPFPIWGVSAAIGTAAYSISCTFSASSRALTGSAGAFANVRRGQYITGTGIAHGTYVTAKNSNTSLTISKDTTAAGPQTLSFSRRTGCSYSVCSRLKDVNVNFPNSGGAIFFGYGTAAPVFHNVKTNAYSFGSFTQYNTPSPAGAIPLGSVHMYGVFYGSFDNLTCQSPAPQSGGGITAPHTDIDSVGLSLLVSSDCRFKDLYYEALSTFLEDGVDWRGSGEDTYGYKQNWCISMGSSHRIVFDAPIFQTASKKKDPAYLSGGVYYQGYPPRILRTLNDVGGNGFTIRGGGCANWRLYYSNAGAPLPAVVAPFESGGFAPVPENGSLTSDPYDRDDFLLQSFEDGTVEGPVHIEDFQIINYSTGKTRRPTVPSSFGIHNREAFRIENDARTLRLGPWTDSDLTAVSTSMDDLRVNSAFTHPFRGGQFGYVRGQGTFSVADVVSDGSNVITSPSNGFGSVAVGMKVTDDFSRFPGGSYVTSIAGAPGSVTISAAVTAHAAGAASFWALGGLQREGLWGASTRDSDFRQIPWIRNHTSPWTNIKAGDFWNVLSGTPVSSEYPNAQFCWYSNGAWQAALGLPRTTTAAGDIPYYSATDTLARLAHAGSAARVLRTTGASTLGWGQVDLTTDVTGDLSYANLTPSANASRILGRTSASAGDWAEMSVGGRLQISGTTLQTQTRTKAIFIPASAFETTAKVNYGATSNLMHGITCPDAAVTIFTTTFMVPTDRNAGGSYKVSFSQSGTNGGDFFWRLHTLGLVVGTTDYTAATGETSSDLVTTALGTANVLQETGTGGGAYASDTLVRLVVERLGTDGLDTNTDDGRFHGVVFSYTADV